MGFAISRYWPDARTGGISLPHPSCFPTMVIGRPFRDLPRSITLTPCRASSWLVTRAFCTHAKLTSLGILLCILTGSPAVAQSNAKNVLLLWTAFERSTERVDLLESTVRAHVPGQI